MYIGDILLGQTIDVKFTTVQSTGAPTTLSGTPVVSCYVGNSTTQLTGGITLTADFDGVTGLNNVRVVATAANSYTQMSDNYLVITTGTVNSVSAVGYVVGAFSIQNRYSAGLLQRGTLAAGAATTADLVGSYADDIPNGATLAIIGGTGAGQARLVTDFADANNRATVDTWTTTVDNTSVYELHATPPGSTSVPAPANMTQVAGVAVSTSTAQIGVAVVTQPGDYTVTFSGTPTATGGTVDVDVGTDVRRGRLRLTSGALAGESLDVTHTWTTIAALHSLASLPTRAKQFSAAPASGVTGVFTPW